MRWGWKVALLVPVVVVAAPAALLIWSERTYFDEFNELNERLSAIPGIRVVRSGGNHDITYEDLFADLEMVGKGRLRLHNLTLSSYDTGIGLELTHVGGLEPRTAGCDYFGVTRISDSKRVRSEYRGYGIDIGPSGAFAPDLRGGIQGVEDGVRRFDELRALLASWPVCPRSEYRKTPEGWFRYCVERVASDKSSLEASSWPFLTPDGSSATEGPCTEEPKTL